MRSSRNLKDEEEILLIFIKSKSLFKINVEEKKKRKNEEINKHVRIYPIMYVRFTVVIIMDRVFTRTNDIIVKSDHCSNCSTWKIIMHRK